ncbi:hypothetical protein Dimus_002767 [Dionaea muscipula]
MKIESHGSVIGRSLGGPNSSSASSSSFVKISFFRYANGIMNRLLSNVYTMKCPFSALGVVPHGASSMLLAVGCDEEEILFLLKEVKFCHFLAILMRFLWLIIFCLNYLEEASFTCCSWVKQ